jgi:hypothetical protein
MRSLQYAAVQVYSLVGVVRVGDDLHSTLGLQLYQALLGAAHECAPARRHALG